MELKSKSFTYIKNLVDFVNENGIKKEQIQQIIAVNDSVCITLLYWE